MVKILNYFSVRLSETPLKGTQQQQEVVSDFTSCRVRGSVIIQSYSLTENMGPVSTTFSTRRTFNSSELPKRHYKLIVLPTNHYIILAKLNCNTQKESNEKMISLFANTFLIALLLSSNTLS